MDDAVAMFPASANNCFGVVSPTDITSSVTSFALLILLLTSVEPNS